MKLEEMSEDLISFFISKEILDKFDLYNEDDLETFLKENILLLKEKYKIYLYGLYTTEVFVNKNIGAFVNMKKEDILFSKKTIDLRIKIIFECKFYFKTDNFNLLEHFNDVYFYDGEYYVNADYIDKLINYIEHGKIVYEDEFDIESCYIKIK